MKADELTARQILEIKGSFLYFILVASIASIAAFLQIIGGKELKVLLITNVFNAIGIFMAYMIFHRKKRLHSTTVLSWIVAAYTVCMPMLAKYNYVMNFGWKFSVDSYHLRSMIFGAVILIQYMYNKKIFIFFYFLAFLEWSAFLYAAHLNGIEMHLISQSAGKAVQGIPITHELMFMLGMCVIAFAVYMNIPTIDDFEKKTTEQSEMIKKQSKAQMKITDEIKDKMNNLFEQVGTQNNVIGKFNSKIQNQAATFEEISATLEELFGASESISDMSIKQVNENRSLESTISDFKIIKDETKKNLATTIIGMDSVMKDTNIGKEKINAIEETISSMKGQSSEISETVSIITDIADRINLLSLNASIEAARAGDYGKGFAVVADEIGKLAFQTTESIKDIEKIMSFNIKTIDEGVTVIQSAATTIRDMIMNIEESSKKIKNLKDSISIEERHLDQIVEQTEKNVALSESIGKGTDEQKLSIEHSTRAVEQVNEILSELTDGINEIADASGKIFTNAENLLSISKKTAIE